MTICAQRLDFLHPTVPWSVQVDGCTVRSGLIPSCARRAAALAAALGMLATAPAPAEVDLQGRNHMAAQRSASQAITLTKGIAVNRGGYYGEAAGDPGATFSLGATGGEFLAAQLRRETPNGRGYHPSVFGIRNGSTVHTLATDNILPPGRYQLMLLTDGTDPWLTLDIADRGGEQQIPVHQELPLLTARAHDASAGGVSRAGASLELPTAALLHARTDLTADGPARAEVCEYKSTVSPSSDFGPGCPNGQSLSVETLSHAGPGDCCMFFTLFDMEPGFYAFGGNITSSAATSADVYMSAVPYPPPSTAPSAPVPTPEAPQPSPRLAWMTIGNVRPVHGRRVRARVRCHDPAGCRGRLTGTRKPHTVVLGQDQQWNRAVDLTARQRRSLRLRRRTVIRLRLSGQDAGGRQRVVERRAVLRR